MQIFFLEISMAMPYYKFLQVESKIAKSREETLPPSKNRIQEI